MNNNRTSSLTPWVSALATPKMLDLLEETSHNRALRVLRELPMVVQQANDCKMDLRVAASKIIDLNSEIAGGLAIEQAKTNTSHCILG